MISVTCGLSRLSASKDLSVLLSSDGIPQPDLERNSFSSCCQHSEEIPADRSSFIVHDPQAELQPWHKWITIQWGAPTIQTHPVCSGVEHQVLWRWTNLVASACAPSSNGLPKSTPKVLPPFCRSVGSELAGRFRPLKPRRVFHDRTSHRCEAPTFFRRTGDRSTEQSEAAYDRGTIHAGLLPRNPGGGRAKAASGDVKEFLESSWMM